MKQIYVAYTPYHFLLSCGLAALSGSSENKYLIIIPVYSDVNVFNMLLNEWSNNPFCKIIMTNGIFNVSGKIQQKRYDKIYLGYLKIYKFITMIFAVIVRLIAIQLNFLLL